MRNCLASCPPFFGRSPGTGPPARNWKTSSNCSGNVDRQPMDPRKFKAPFLRRSHIWEKADELRSRFPSCAKLPVPVLDLAEFDLGLELLPKARLKQAGDLEALLLGDLKTIVVDRDAFMDPRAENRLRFSVAHEIGHLILHPDVYGQLQHPGFQESLELLIA